MMSIILHLLFLLSFAFPVVWSETILSDSLGNAIGLPLGGPNTTASVINLNSLISTSPYIFLSVYINNGNNGPSSGYETFYIVNNNNGLWGNASLIKSGYSRTFSIAALTYNTTAGQYLGSSSSPMNMNGLFQFTFFIPVGGVISVDVSYSYMGQPASSNNTVVTFLIYNPMSPSNSSSSTGATPRSSSAASAFLTSSALSLSSSTDSTPPMSPSSTGSTPQPPTSSSSASAASPLLSSSSLSSTGSMITEINSGSSNSLSNSGMIAIVVTFGLVFVNMFLC